jgi:hypothetical protein
MSEARMQQYRVDSMLQFGIICSVVWMMGFGSLCAFVCGLRAERIIKASAGQVVGMGRARWCIVVGGVGVFFALTVLIVATCRRVMAN